jgi:hypothetical protein
LTRGSSFDDRSRGFGIAGRELLHLVAHVECLAWLQIDLLLVAAMPGHEYFELVIARFDMQTLEGAVEVIDRARVIAVNKDLSLTRIHLQA